MTLSTDDRYREWTEKPARPVRYSLWQRWSDRRNGRRDGNSGLPFVVVAEKQPDTGDGQELLPAPGATVVPASTTMAVNTPYVAMLACLFHELATHEAIGWEDRSQPLRSRLGIVNAKLVELHAVLDEHRQQLKTAAEPPDETARGVRRAVEIQNKRPEYLSRRRRLVTHAQNLAEAERRYLATLERGQTVAAEVLDLTEQIAAERRVAAARVRRVHAHVLRRVAGYWRHLVLTHEHGRTLTAWLCPAGPELPPWVLDLDDDQYQEETP